MFHVFRSTAMAVMFFAAGMAAAQSMPAPTLPAPGDNTINSEPGYLGMVADDREENGKGVRLVEVDNDSPAARAGLQGGDLVTAINGRPVHSLDEFAAVLKPLSAGAKVAFDLDRQNAAQHVEVTLGRRPAPDQRRFKDFGRLPDAPPEENGAAPSNPSLLPTPGNPAEAGAAVNSGPRLGLRTVPVTEATRLRLGLSSTAGALVVARTMGSPAERARIPLDSVITSFNGMAVQSPSDLAALVARAPEVGQVDLAYVYNGRGFRANVVMGQVTSAPPPSRSPMANAAPRSMPPQGSSAGNIPRSPVVTPPQSTTRLMPQSGNDPGRIEALERRVRELEQRIQELEARQQRGA
jgi:PDZ domain